MKITSSLMHCSFYGMGDILLLTKSLVMREECDCHPHKSQWNLAAKWATSQQCNTVTMQDSNSTRELITVQACKACTLPEQRSLWGARSRDGEIIAAWSTDLSSAGWLVKMQQNNKTIISSFNGFFNSPVLQWMIYQLGWFEQIKHHWPPKGPHLHLFC